jgi:hypothetical protein
VWGRGHSSAAINSGAPSYSMALVPLLAVLLSILTQLRTGLGLDLKSFVTSLLLP